MATITIQEGYKSGIMSGTSAVAAVAAVDDGEPGNPMLWTPGLLKIA